MEAPQLAFKNKEALQKATICGCYRCLKIFSPNDIKEWTDKEETAVCPHCGSDCLLPEANQQTLVEAKKKWFSL